jgi:Reverse transcriptase (RNA-dependent DNA polymerase)
MSVIDARAGYWQTPVKLENQWLLVFATHHGLWQWTRTPFGAKNSGSTFIRAMQVVLKPLQDINANYVDDMGVGSHSWPSHLVDLRRYLNAIKTAGVTLNLQQSEFAKPFVKCVGHIIGSGLKYADTDKIDLIQQIPRPTTQKQLKSFLGMMAYHRAYIDHVADLAKCLTDLTSVKYSKTLIWSEACEQVFFTLKAKLCNVVA